MQLVNHFSCTVSVEGGAHVPTLTASRTVSNYYKSQFPVVRVQVDLVCMIKQGVALNNTLQQSIIAFMDDKC